MCEYVHACASPSHKECIIQISLNSRVYKTLLCSACSLSKLSYRPSRERQGGRERERKRVRERVMGCIKTEESSGIIECSLVPGEVEVVTVQSLQAQIYQYADAPSSSVPPSSSQSTTSSNSSRPPPGVLVLSFMALHSLQQRFLIAPLTAISSSLDWSPAIRADLSCFLVISNQLLNIFEGELKFY